MLVSIIVITYNSSRFIIETLESAYHQNYQDIELIVSDDCSSDDTYDICQQWINLHKERFVRAVCTQTLHNKGICGNYNHALKFAQGDWIKYIAGDDLLCYNCIEKFVLNIRPNVFLYFCGVYMWNMQNNQVDIISSLLPNATYRKQLIIMLKQYHTHSGPGIFIERQHLIALNGFDTQYPLVEDLTIVLKYLTNHLQIGENDTPLVIWRNHQDNTSLNNELFWPSVGNVLKYYSRNYCWRYGLFLYQYHYFVYYWDKTHTNTLTKKIIRKILLFFDIVYWRRNRVSIHPFNIKKIQTISYSDKLIQNHEIDSK
jgi:alpha-1,3-rhamnosyltransferase